MKKFFLALTSIITLSLILLPWSFLVAQTTTDAVTNVTADDSAAAAAGALTATITSPADNYQTPIGQTITFNGTAVGGEPPYVFHWDFGDGTTFNGRPRSQSYAAAGTYEVKLTVTDFSGARRTASLNVTVTNPTPVSPLAVNITNPAVGREALVDEMIDFSAATAGGEPPYVFHWDFGDGTTFNGQTRQRSYSAAGTKTVTVTATDFAGATATHSITLKINSTTPSPTPPPSTTLTISTIRVTDITTTSAIVRWTTNNPATSRVIYDTVSHPNLDSQTAPNFGYASSTVTADIDAKVTDHAVTVSNLLPNTDYYFRVISQ